MERATVLKGQVIFSGRYLADRSYGKFLIMSDEQKKTARPPRISEWLLYWLTEAEYRDQLLGDMEANWESLIKEYGRSRADSIYIAQTIHSIIPLAVSKIRTHWSTIARLAKDLAG